MRTSERFAWSPQVHQAKGMIVAQAGVDTVEALLRLIAHSNATGRTVQYTALEVIERRLRFDIK